MVRQERKRRKIDIMATPQQFKAVIEEVKKEDVEMVETSTYKDITEHLKRKGSSCNKDKTK